jgi:hypothetical protein
MIFRMMTASFAMSFVVRWVNNQLKNIVLANSCAVPKLGILPLRQNTSTQMGVYKAAGFVFFLSGFFSPSLVENEFNRFSCYLQTHASSNPRPHVVYIGLETQVTRHVGLSSWGQRYHYLNPHTSHPWQQFKSLLGRFFDVRKST